jgi:hypothetical protein
MLMLGALLQLLSTHVSAQSPTAPQPDPLMQLMLSQPSIEISTNVEIRAVFDPPIVKVGEKSTYRVTINAVSDSVRWPEDIYTPSELTVKTSARGQTLQPGGPVLKPTTTINHHVTASATGDFTIPEFKVKVYGRNVTVPSARLIVSTSSNTGSPGAPRLYVEISETNAYCGQPLKVRVLMPATQNNFMQALQQLQLNGDGILLDQSAARQSIKTIEFNGRSSLAFIYESTVTPLVAGRIELSAQAFTTGNQFAGAITIQGGATIQGGMPQYVLVDSDPVRLTVQPLPRAGTLPGFNGAIGTFTLDTTQLSTNRVRVGDAVKLLVTFRTEGEIKRLIAPPPPGMTNWQIFPPLPEGGPTLSATTNSITSSQTYSYTLIALTNDMVATPAIPFSYFDPRQKTYVNLTIPSVAIEILAGAATAEAQAIAQSAAAAKGGERLKLSGLANTPGRAASLSPLQFNSRFLWGQLVPILGFTGLWLWDRRRRHYEMYPELLVRKRARRALCRQRVELNKAARTNNAARFVEIAVSAMQIGSAPHFPAEPGALVGRDVLELLEETERVGREGTVVRTIFSAIDAAQFSIAPAEIQELLALHADLDRVLDKLNAKLD